MTPTPPPGAGPGERSPTPLDVTLLKNRPYGVAPAVADRGGTALPYRIDHLIDHGCRLHYTDAPYAPRLRRFHDPLVQTLALAPHLARHPVTLAMFESSGHPYGLLRYRLPPARRAVFVVLSCWLPELLVAADATRLERYRRAYATVDRLYTFSHNQTALVSETLGLEDHQVRPLALGVDHTVLRPQTVPATGPFLAVGRDRGRDWPTLFAALRASELPTQVLCRPADIAGLDLPPNVEVLGTVDRTRYRSLLQNARGVLVATHVLGYPTGQTVLLEAMACARPVVATTSPALDDYLDPGRSVLTVAPGDVDGWVDALRAIDRAEVDVQALGAAARRAVERSFTAEAMWSAVAQDIRALVADRAGDR